MNEFSGLKVRPIGDQLIAMRGRRFNEDEAAWESNLKPVDSRAIARAEQLVERLRRQDGITFVIGEGAAVRSVWRERRMPDLATGDGTGAVVLSRHDREKHEIETYRIQPSGEINREVYVDQILRVEEKVEL